MSIMAQRSLASPARARAQIKKRRKAMGCRLSQNKSLATFKSSVMFALYARSLGKSSATFAKSLATFAKSSATFAKSLVTFAKLSAKSSATFDKSLATFLATFAKSLATSAKILGCVR